MPAESEEGLQGDADLNFKAKLQKSMSEGRNSIGKAEKHKYASGRLPWWSSS